MIRLPIRLLVELIMRGGDIDSRYVSKDRMLEGARAHRILQKQHSELYDDYRSEVILSAGYNHDGTDYTLEGRADGVFRQDDRYTLEEIKTTLRPISLIDEEFNQAHWGQAQCYAYIFAIENDLPEISVQLTYFNLESHESKNFTRNFSAAELKDFVSGLLAKYSAWASFSSRWAIQRDLSIKALPFPFPAYRQGQRALAEDAYRTIANGQKMFTQAPTGTGKTISVLFPAVKAIGEGKTSKIFYLTAKTITRQAAEEAFDKMRRVGLRIKTLTITAKEKICFCDQTVCSPDRCEYAKGHYDRINDAILDAIEACDEFSRQAIESYAQKHRVCPFELSLDIALLADGIICDYNYVFDPRAYLRRFFTEGGDYVFLIDEAHNLVDRSREMYSAQLRKTDFYTIKKEYKGKNKALDKCLTSINKFMIELRHQCGEAGYLVTADLRQDFIELVNKYAAVCELMLKEKAELSEDQTFMQLYFEVLGFMTIADFYDERYVTLVEDQGTEVILKLFCMDPSFLLAEALKRGKSAIMFSATLSPLTYFRDILGGGQGDRLLSLDSPFDPRKLCVMIADTISTRYTEREQSRSNITQLIGSFVSSKIGNYIVYFPSYKYMNDVFEEFIAAFPEINAVKQSSGMSEPDRENFLASLVEEPEETLVAFCVLGGIFSEGIDLVGSRLIGTVIVSVGLPQLGVQQDIIRDYFKQRNGMGYEYAYMYPGMNKVLQAAGRVIRCESDMGAIMLVDERYRRRDYERLFPKNWHTPTTVRDRGKVEKTLGEFWGAE